MIVRYINALSNVLVKPLRVRQTPIHIQVEATTYCNLNCTSCARSKYLEAAKHLTPENFQLILSQIHPLKVSLSGAGEPFMNPHFFDLIQIARNSGCSVNTTTNGTLFTLENCPQLVKSGLDLIKISIDAATPETHQKNRGAGRFSQVVEGIRILTDVKKRFNSAKPFIRFNYVVTHDNYHEMADVVALAHTLDVDAVYFQPLDLTGIEERQDLLVGDLTYEELLQAATEAINVSQQQQIRTNLQDITKKLPLYWRKYQMQLWDHDTTRICILPWFSAYITLEGIVRPCCSCFQEYTNMGNILESPFETVWNSAKYQQFRKAIRAGQRPFKICQNCVPQTLPDIIRYFSILPGFLR